jgi:predicted nucleotide-binding protein
MAKLPIEIVRIGNDFNKEIEEVIDLINKTQQEICFSLLSTSDEEKFQLLNYKDADVDEQLDKIGKIRNDLKGYHPYVIAVSGGHLRSKYNNLFGSCKSVKGIAIFTFHNVPDIIIPKSKIKSYICYFLSRYVFNFLIPDHINHSDTRDCVFDFKQVKTDILKSMKDDALCDECRSKVSNPSYSMSAAQFNSLNSLFAKSGELLNSEVKDVESKTAKPKIFVGSSIEGIEVARKIQNELNHEFEIIIWNQGIFDRLGLSFLETLEETVNNFDYGVFIFTPDDTIQSRGETKKIARDNVIFELGMFIGKLTRKKGFLVHPQSMDLHILSDFNGITKATYDSTTSNLQASLGPVCDKIRTSIK